MSEFMPKVSVIIPTYNRAKYVVETLHSVFDQTYTDYEVIVVDDGSTDNTRDVLNPYLLNNQTTYIYKKNGGPASARNVGIKASNGEYIAFLDSDDLWLPQKLNLQVKYLETYKDIGLVFSDAEAFGENIDSESIANASFKFTGHNPSFHLLLWGNFIPVLTVMIRRECIEKVGYFDESSELIGGEDYELWLRLSRRFKLGHINQILAKYRLTQKSVLGTNHNKAFNLHLNIINRMFNLYPSISEEIGYKRYQILATLCLNYGYIDINSKNFQAAKRKFQRALSYHPFYWKAIRDYFFATYKSMHTTATPTSSK